MSTTHSHNRIPLGNIATIYVPNYLKPLDKVALDLTKFNSSMYSGDLCRYENSGASYATFSVIYHPNDAVGWDGWTAEDKLYDKELDDALRMQHETPEAQKTLKSWIQVTNATLWV